MPGATHTHRKWAAGAAPRDKGFIKLIVPIVQKISSPSADSSLISKVLSRTPSLKAADVENLRLQAKAGCALA